MGQVAHGGLDAVVGADKRGVGDCELGSRHGLNLSFVVLGVY